MFISKLDQGLSRRQHLAASHMCVRPRPGPRSHCQLPCHPHPHPPQPRALVAPQQPDPTRTVRTVYP